MNGTFLYFINTGQFHAISTDVLGLFFNFIYFFQKFFKEYLQSQKVWIQIGPNLSQIVCKVKLLTDYKSCHLWGMSYWKDDFYKKFIFEVLSVYF